MHTVRSGLFALVALSFPISAAAVFLLGFDRIAVADALASVYGLGLPLALSTPFWPGLAPREWSANDRVQSLVFAFLTMSYVTHLTWELGWLVFRDAIVDGRDRWWAFLWWAYIDGGDRRYGARGDVSDLVAMEVLSVLNGLVGSVALVAYHRLPPKSSAMRRYRRRHVACVLALTATAVVHLYSASMYYLVEWLRGMPNVDPGFYGLVVKFSMANAPWVVCPFFVFAWGFAALTRE